MRRLHRLVLLAALTLAAPVLAGCENFDMDKLDIFGLNAKKKLPGERKEVFPGGVPGVTQGIPPEYMIGNRQQQQDAAQTPASAPADAATPQGAAPKDKTAAIEPAAQPKPKAKPKSKPKPRTATRPPTQVTVQPAAKTDTQQPLQPWPDQNQPAAQGQSTAPWPAAPAPGTFSR